MIREKYIQAGVSLRHKYALSNLVITLVRVDGDNILCKINVATRSTLVGKTITYSRNELITLFDFEKFADKLVDLQFQLEEE